MHCQLQLSMELIRIGVIEDNKVINRSLCESIKVYSAMELVFNAFSIEEAFQFLEENVGLQIDIILLDIGLPGMDGLTAIPLIRQRLKNTDIIMLTTYEEGEKVFQALSSGACSYISKKTSLKVIMEAIYTVHRGGAFMSPSIARKVAEFFLPIQETPTPSVSNLTPRQMDIVKALSKGLSYKMISTDLDISIDTVRTHIKTIYRSLEVNSKIQVINLYRDGKI